jgi:hypothetical protein
VSVSDYGFDLLGGLTPPFKVFREPIPGRVYSLGVDTAEGLGHGDQSCVQVVDAGSGEQMAVFCERIPPDLIASVAYRMARWYNGGLLVVEANNHGIATLNVLRQMGYRSIYRRRQVNRLYNRVTEEFGFKTTRSTKPLIISGLDEAIRNGEVQIHEYETFVELKGYVRDEAGRMNGSPFDDRVIALALAQHGRAFMHQREAEDAKRDDYMTFAWWMRQGEEKQGGLVVGSRGRRKSKVDAGWPS